MIHTDLYGEFKITNSMWKIIKNRRFIRLFGIYQNGPAAYIDEKRKKSNRGLHSIGVSYIIKKLGGNEEEMIAGLIHDIAHFPFSHAIDYELSKKTILLMREKIF